ncbi:4Fe-4S dicluster domain-containing protein [Nannocystis sp. ILAH1]|uniref:4Fe-4S dicluster domain-containing protein n=1 Tax=unclassified Nannocystis TaxID=2627009 RepID=UPI00226D714D|nr:MULTISPECIES: 4Fe-4S dicluster domain-containing protein [unclassified Nannocystis]MCY0993644.1 4Fe-4S dicluster domain-containing protein [Nannocystis sp. ILAH1]MCY1065993.1 4Fe-4S dicluster domain-containing protein [Nannocystis sp. RBIL2]
MTKSTDNLKAYWRSLADHDGTLAPQHDEFPGLKDASALASDSGANSFVPATSLARRKFMGLVGASTALASAGCVRKPVEHIVPLSKRPEDTIPGQAVYYATAYQVGGTVQGLLVESQDGRPTKVEGNPRHSGSLGATDSWAQASVMSLYDPARSRTPLKRAGEGQIASDWDTVTEELGAKFKELRGKQGEGLAVVLPTVLSPSLREAVKTFTTNFPKAKLFDGDVVGSRNANAGAELLCGAGTRFTYHIQGKGSAGGQITAAGTRVIFSVDSDFLCGEQDSVRLQREFAAGRDVHSQADAGSMNRLYVVEPHFSITGAQADHRLRMRASQVGAVLVALANEIKGSSKAPSGAEAVLDALPAVTLTDAEQKFVKVLAKDLLAAKDARDAHSLVIVGERQPAWAHALGLLINVMLGNVGSSVRLRHDDTAVVAEPLTALAAALGAGIDTVLVVECNPAYEAPGELDLAGKLKGVTVIHHGLYNDETGKLAAWHLPATTYFEAWGDLEAADATISIVQPLIAPLHQSKSALELLSWIASDAAVDGYSLVQGYWRKALGAMWSDKVWRRWLHDGVVHGVPRSGQNPIPREYAKVAEAIKAADFTASGFEVNFHVDPKVADGRFSNIAWLQELPHPMTKLTWDNAAYVSIGTARKLGVENCDLVTVTVGGKSVQIPVWIAPGQADDTVSLALGYGRQNIGLAADGAGVDVYPLQPAANPWFVQGGTVAKAGGQRKIYSTQDWGSLSPAIDMASTRDDNDPKLLNPGRGYPDRPIVRETTVEDFKATGREFAVKGDLMKDEQLVSLWDHNTHPDFGAPAMVGKQQWGMVIDLNKCNGCSACVVACQAENNIPVVGRAQVANGREMHWIRLDRYYSGAKEDPAAVVQPMLCQHCETAPCENVCPVAATAHSPEGLNDMAYNRCIGTRYCANNCPYKVRRFNFFNFNRDPMNSDDEKLLWMQKNPDVTVRFRGVIEKCSYCVQRIQEAKIQAHVAGEDTVKDGAIVVACEQSCASQAIVFGDVADPTTRVAQLRTNVRHYGVLTDLNTRPRTTYLGRIRNPNTELAPSAPAPAAAPAAAAPHGAAAGEHKADHAPAH